MEANKKNNIKIISAIIAIVVAICAILGVAKFKNTKTKDVTNKSISKSEIPKKIYIRYAFADVDFDQIIQDVDSKDDDPNADYIFIRFNGKIVPSKVKNSIFDIKNYKLDGKEIPKNSQILIDSNSGNTTLIVKLPNGLLKGNNAGHSLEINNNVNINNITKIEGELKFKLPYSTKTKSSLEKTNDKKNKENNSKSNLENNKKSDSKDVKEKDKLSGDSNLGGSKQQNQGQTPKYSIEIGKGIPFTTIVLIKLEVKDPSKYIVQVGEDKLDMKKNKEGKLVFVKGIKKDYSYDDVQDRLKITKVK